MTRRGESRSKVTADAYFAMVPEWVLYAPISATALRLYCVLHRIANDASSEGFAKRTTLAERLAGKDAVPVSVKTVDRATAELETIGAVEVIPQFDAAGDRRENRYKVITREPEVASATTGGGDTGVATPGHSCPDGGDTDDATVATPESLQGNQSPSTRAHESEGGGGTRAWSSSSRGRPEEEDPVRSTIADTGLAVGGQVFKTIVANLTGRARSEAAHDERAVASWHQFFEKLGHPEDGGCRVELRHRLGELAGGGWSVDGLAAELAAGIFDPDRVGSPAAVLLTRARDLDEHVFTAGATLLLDHELIIERTQALAAARAYTFELVRTGADRFDVDDDISARYAHDTELLDAAWDALDFARQHPDAPNVECMRGPIDQAAIA